MWGLRVERLSGWMWRYNGRAWLQCFGMLYEGVLFFFKDRETCDMFRMLAVRDEEAVFIAAQLCDGFSIGLSLSVKA